MNLLFRRAAAMAAAAFFVCVPQIFAGSARYEFTGGSLSPKLTNVPAGVTVDPLVLGAKFLAAPGVSGNLFDQGGGPDSLRITAADGTTAGTSSSFTAGTTLSFTVHIPADVTVSLHSLSLRYKSTSVVGRSNARVFSSVRGHLNATADTIGILGNDGEGTDVDFVLDTINLVAPRTAGGGGNIQDTDFANLSGISVTFEIPWMDGNDAATSFIDLDDLTLNFVEPPVPANPSVRITDFQVLNPQTARVSLAGDSGTHFSLMASDGLVGPLYRLRWTPVMNGIFDGTAKTFTDPNVATKPKRFYVAAGSDVPKARILPIGDSITAGDGAFWVYRGPLYDKLTTAGFRFEYVGWSAADYVSPLYGRVNLKFGAKGGDNAQIVASKVVANFPANVADIALIHAGHNYDLKDESEAAIITKIENATRTIISACRAGNPKIVILLAQVITSPKLSTNSTVVKYAYIPALNVRLAEVGAELNTPASPIIIVNQAAGWNTPTDAISDEVHPSEAGAEKMAVKWFNALSPLLE